MPIDPRIALGVQPVQMPDFMGYANQAANILQSRASEQNALALMAQRQRQEQQALKLTNALRGLDPTNPEAVNQLYQLPGGAAEAENIFKAKRAQTEAGTAAMAASSARNESSLKRIASFNNWLQAWANIAEEEEKGLDPAKAGAVRQALRQAYNADPTPQGFENWKRQTMFGLLTPEQQLSTTRVTHDLGGTIQEKVVPTFGQQPGTTTFTPTMTPYQRAQLAQQERQARIAQEAPQPLPGNPGMFYDKQARVWVGTVGPDPNKPEPTLTQLQRHSDGTFRADNIDDLTTARLPVDAIGSARGARVALETLGYGGQKMQFIMDALRNAPQGGLDSYITDIKRQFGESSPQAEAVAILGNLQANIVIDRLFGRLGAGISNADVTLVQNSSGVMTDPNSTREQREAAFLGMINYLAQKARYPNLLNASPAAPPPMSSDAMSFFNNTPAPAAPSGVPTRQNPMFPLLPR